MDGRIKLSDKSRSELSQKLNREKAVAGVSLMCRVGEKRPWRYVGTFDHPKWAKPKLTLFSDIHDRLKPHLSFYSQDEKKLKEAKKLFSEIQGQCEQLQRCFQTVSEEQMLLAQQITDTLEKSLERKALKRLKDQFQNQRETYQKLKRQRSLKAPAKVESKLETLKNELQKTLARLL